MHNLKIHIVSDDLYIRNTCFSVRKYIWRWSTQKLTEVFCSNYDDVLYAH